MNYSDYDSDGYSSNADADYVPSGKYTVMPLVIVRTRPFLSQSYPILLRLDYMPINKQVIIYKY